VCGSHYNLTLVTVNHEHEEEEEEMVGDNISGNVFLWGERQDRP